jgi:hypothetical protein
MSKIKGFFGEMFSENGKISSGRVMAFYIVLLGGAACVAVVIVCLIKSEYKVAAWVASGMVSMGISGKIISKKVE